jgi:hypothetical protein
VGTKWEMNKPRRGGRAVLMYTLWPLREPALYFFGPLCGDASQSSQLAVVENNIGWSLVQVGK